MKRKILITAIASAILFNNVACSSANTVDENGYSIITERQFNAYDEACKPGRAERDEARKPENRTSDTDWYVFIEGLGVIRDDVSQKMPVDYDCADWYCHSPEGMFIKYAWKSGDKYYCNYYECNNYTKGAYPVFQLDDNDCLVEVEVYHMPPG